MNNLPQHIAVVMDGNGRWAKQHNLSRLAGHEEGVKTARMLIEACAKKKISVLSLFAFSSENWQRPQIEVNAIMDLFLKVLDQELNFLHDYQISLRFIGDRSKFRPRLVEKIENVEHLTATNLGMKLLIAADYGGQWDICQAARTLAAKVETNELTSAEITSELLASHLSFADLPDPDFFIRTSGEYRVSNFMLWQLAYAELYFTQTLWPAFTEEEFNAALQQYGQRQRRFGLSGEQIQCSKNA